VGEDRHSHENCVHQETCGIDRLTTVFITHFGYERATNHDTNKEKRTDSSELPPSCTLKVKLSNQVMYGGRWLPIDCTNGILVIRVTVLFLHPLLSCRWVSLGIRVNTRGELALELRFDLQESKRVEEEHACTIDDRIHCSWNKLETTEAASLFKCMLYIQSL